MNDNFKSSEDSNVIKFVGKTTNDKPIIDVTEEERRNDLVQTLDDLRNMVADGKMDDVVIVARNIENGLFFTEMAIRKSTYNSPEIGTIGAMLNSLSIECSDALQMAPYTDLSGNVYSPTYETSDDEDNEDDSV